MASCLDNYWSQHFLCTAVPHKLCYISPGVAVVGHFCFTEELPACTGRTIPPSSGSPRLRDGRTVPQKTQNVDGTQSGQRGTNPNSYLQLLRTIFVALFIDELFHIYYWNKTKSECFTQNRIVFFLLSFATKCVSKVWSSHRPVHPPPATASPCACLLWTVQTPHLPQTVLMLALRPRGVQRLPAPAASQKPRVSAWDLAWGLDWALAQEWWWEVTAGEREQRRKLL